MLGTMIALLAGYGMFKVVNWMQENPEKVKEFFSGKKGGPPGG